MINKSGEPPEKRANAPGPWPCALGKVGCERSAAKQVAVGPAASEYGLRALAVTDSGREEDIGNGPLQRREAVAEAQAG